MSTLRNLCTCIAVCSESSLHMLKKLLISYQGSVETRGIKINTPIFFIWPDFIRAAIRFLRTSCWLASEALLREIRMISFVHRFKSSLKVYSRFINSRT